MAYQDARRLGMRTHQPIECDDVRDHQHGHVDESGSRMWRPTGPPSRKPDLDGVVIVEDEVGRPHEIEGDHEQPKERPYPYGEKRQDGQHSGCKVAISGERGEASRQARADDAWKNKNQPEEAEAVQSSDDTLRFEPVHRPEPGQDVRAEAKQARDIA